MAGGHPLSSLTAPSPAVYSIDAGTPFLTALAKPILSAYATDSLALSDLTIYLPNRRAARALADAFYKLRQGAGQESVLLPRIRALGDVDEEDLFFTGTAPQATEALLPAADPMSRRLILAKLIRQHPDYTDAGWPAAIRAADELGQLLDSFHLEDVPLDKLADLVPDDVVKGAAAHWQHSLEFLSIISEHWPTIMQAYGWMEPMARRRQMMRALTDGLRDNPPKHPIIVAGSLGTIRATGELMAQVSKLPNGLVVLPGLDREMDDRAWSEIDPPHPQALFRERLNSDFEIDRSNVLPWPEQIGDALAARRSFLSLALRPANATDDWYTRFETFQAEGQLEPACQGLTLAEAETQQEEATFVSLLIRETLAMPNKTIMVITPDRQLARRVTTQLSAWGLDLDDSGGVPLSGTYRGTFLRNLSAFFGDPASPTAILTLIKHPLFAAGRDPNAIGPTVRALDLALRGPRRDFSGEQLLQLVKDGNALLHLRPQSEEVVALLSELQVWALSYAKRARFRERMEILVEAAEALATIPDQSGATRLWRYEDGEALADFLAVLLNSDDLPDDVPPTEDTDLLESFLAGGGVVRTHGGHPRVAIYGLLEARLQTADRVILAGLNEGIWPDAAPTDSFLSRPMRARLGLPSPEQMIGRAAHDFAQAAALPDVTLTWSARRGRAPAAPSRWLVRLKSFLAKADKLDALSVATTLRSWSAAIEQPETVTPLQAIPPTPPLEARPRRLSVTEVGTLIRDPYAIYAKHILRLTPLDDLETEIGPRERGTLYHGIFERFAKQHKDQLPSDVPAALGQIATELYRDFGVPESIQTYWSPNLHRGLSFYESYERTVREEGAPLLIEAKAEWIFNLGDQSFTLVARVDRADNMADGQVSIVDFKTGQAQTIKQDRHFSPQLSLTALMIEADAFGDATNRKVGRISYLAVQEKGFDGNVFHPGRTLSDEDLRDHLSEVENQFHVHLTGYDDPNRGYPSQPRPFLRREDGDYDHLARRTEWGVMGSGEGGDSD